MLLITDASSLRAFFLLLSHESHRIDNDICRDKVLPI